MKFRFTDGRILAYEFTASEPADFINALKVFREQSIKSPAVQKPFCAHLYFQRLVGNWVWVKPFVILAAWENPDMNHWAIVLVNAARTNTYCDELDRFCGDVANEAMFWDKMEGLKKVYDIK